MHVQTGPLGLRAYMVPSRSVNDNFISPVTQPKALATPAPYHPLAHALPHITPVKKSCRLRPDLIASYNHHPSGRHKPLSSLT